uniref:Uncharacterized protein n=1 Tax=Salix viminalis TaxID=40686 RepID=A0A6N2MJ59_SALVM
MVMELSQPVFDSRIDSSSTSGIDELEEQAERETRDRGNEFHCHPLLQLSARLPGELTAETVDFHDEPTLATSDQTERCDR